MDGLVPKQYRYFVAYEGADLVGRVEVFRDSPITTLLDIRGIECDLEKQKGKPVIVTFWRSFEKPE
jgi:hypothetical protein